MHSKKQVIQYRFQGSSKTYASSDEYIFKDVIPVYTVDKEGFRDMVRALNPRYQLPHKDYFSRVAVPSLYEETRQQLAVRMKREANYFLGTADLWSSCTSEPYLCLRFTMLTHSGICKHTVCKLTICQKIIQVHNYKML